jgi:uncharacterized phage protein (TIGR01671 family)
MVDLNAITPFALDIDPTTQGAKWGVYVPDHPDIVVMQFTGLTDKNGKEIYEGDVVRVIETVRLLPSPDEVASREQLDFVGVIEWDNEGADYNIDSKKGDLRGLGVDGQEYEITGNIYENPELLNLIQKEA